MEGTPPSVALAPEQRGYGVWSGSKSKRTSLGLRSRGAAPDDGPRRSDDGAQIRRGGRRRKKGERKKIQKKEMAGYPVRAGQCKVSGYLVGAGHRKKKMRR